MPLPKGPWGAACRSEVLGVKLRGVAPGPLNLEQGVHM